MQIMDAWGLRETKETQNKPPKKENTSLSRQRVNKSEHDPNVWKEESFNGHIHNSKVSC